MKFEEYKSANILVVDDEEEIRELVRDFLEMDGFTNVYTASNGLEGLAIAQSKSIDLILADLFMPQMNGMELFTRLSGLEQIPKFVLVTGSDIGDISEHIDNAIELIAKPFDFEVFIERVSELCRELSAAKSRTSYELSLHHKTIAPCEPQLFHARD